MNKVLIVDDELLMRIGLKSMIDWEKHGFRIVGEAANGREALELAELHQPGLIITDIKMPVMDGLELIREHSRKHEGCRYVILSCLDEFHYAQEAIRLGAEDYLIKSDIKPQELLNVLDKVQKRIAKASKEEDAAVLKEQVKEGIGYLKETLFKELISGFREEGEVIEKADALNIALQQGPMVLIKLRIDRFEHIRRKYVEQDAKLLRYSVVNILEEIISRKRKREIIVENSAEYLLVMNMEGEALKGTEFAFCNAMFARIQETLKDFLNITVTIGISSVGLGFGTLKKAYREADMALKSLFFDGAERIAYYDCLPQRYRDIDIFPITPEDERKFRLEVESSTEGAIRFMTKLNEKLRQEGYTEQAARKAYLSVLSLISSCYPSLPNLNDDGRNMYEQILLEETLEGMDRLARRYLVECEQHNLDLPERPQSYAEQAKTIMLQRYAEDISLQSVADAINVNSSYLSRVFKQETGENFVNFLTKIRIEKAQALLKEKSIRIYEVANRVGYPNTAYFSKLFKKVTGVSPEEYRASAV
ncbi:Protein-glutamate methylesterase/protein-glutamine glutaminase [Paenibacillus auburnensis]|uniref:Protein-glutamate methylesterase/protein-glutamine glutaminase n=1 Tax=Paenibacillus auburnensis TaxID=2905649 RepID=A0ABN8GG97_9BACL|nr:response regulator [Paenibacillus auburnensis]CAH1208279.1 Protein-glutamate methylesterase/protein-glutamine glutaminase [Paenibacillus auburnensis]